MFSIERIFIMSKIKGKHLSYDERLIIEKCIHLGQSKTYIARLLRRPVSTIAYEIKTRRFKSYVGHDKFSCKHLAQCRPGECLRCHQYERATCIRRDRSPGSCNGCLSFRSCKLDRFRYEAKRAQREYDDSLIDSRSGAHLTSLQAKNIANIIKPLLDRGMSPYIIVRQIPELMISEKTLYNYIDDGILPDIGNLDLQRKVRYKVKSKDKRRTKEEREYIKGRTYNDYLKYIEEHNIKDVVLMDTVEGVKGGKVITTFHFVRAHLLFGFLQDNMEATHPLRAINKLTKDLGLTRYKDLFSVILTDRGSEFSKADEIEEYIEKDVSFERGKIFYCDAMQSWQKAEIENAHRNIRLYLPKGTSFNSLTQSDLNKMFSHIASYPIESLNGRTPYEAYSFYFSHKDLESFGINKVDIEHVIRKPILLKQ